MSQTADSDSLVKLVIVIAAVLILGPVLLMLVAAPFMGGMMMLGMPGAGGLAIVGLLITLLVPLLLVVAVLALYRRWGEREREDEALRELRMAFARGEIDREEFEERREALVQEEPRPSEGRWDEPPADDRWEESSEGKSGADQP
ncbi:MAG: putative membrane protein [Halobacteriales archaeon]|jgi:putative membrane protein